MSRAIIFVANGFTKDNVRLQPWRYVYELAKHKALTNTVYVITEGSFDISEEQWEEGFSVVETAKLSVKRQNQLAKYISSLNPDVVWWSTTTRSIAFYPALRSINCRKVAFITSPIYTWDELISASLSGVPYSQTRALWSQRFVPRLLVKKFLNSSIFEKIVVQSKKNMMILDGYEIKDKVSVLPVGIDEVDVEPCDPNVLSEVSMTVNRQQDDFIFLYFGALRPIRGFDALMKAFPGVIEKNPNARLIVLARGASEEKCEAIRSDIERRGLSRNIELVAGWLTREQVWSYIELSDMAVLPFVLVPSDIPIAVLESLARGKPVVSSAVDGLPELVQDKGSVVNPLDTTEFTEIMTRLSLDKAKISEYKKNSIEFTETYPRWADVGKLMDAVDY